MSHKFYCINLIHRKDRWGNFCKEFKDEKIKINRINGIKCEKFPYFGCTLSHKKVIKIGVKEDLEYIIVFEDDVEIKKWAKKKLKQVISETIINTPDDWHIIYLGWLIWTGWEIRKINKYVSKVRGMMCTYWIIYNKKSYKEIINKIQDKSINEITTTETTKIEDYKEIDRWLAYSYQQKFPCYTSNKIIVQEIKSISDIEKKIKNNKYWYAIRFYSYRFFWGKIFNFLSKMKKSFKSF